MFTKGDNSILTKAIIVTQFGREGSVLGIMPEHKGQGKVPYGSEGREGV